MQRMRKPNPIWFYVASYFLLVVSQLLFRFDAAQLTGFPQSWEEGLGVGIFYDIVITLLPFWLYYFAKGLHARFAVILSILLSLTFLFSSFASALYFRFFGSRLYWWVVVNHTGDTTSVWDAIVQIAEQPLILSGFFVGLLSLAPQIWVFRLLRPQRYLFKPPSLLKYWPIEALAALLTLALLVEIQQLPLKHKQAASQFFGARSEAGQLRTQLSDHFLTRWMPEWSRRKTFADFSRIELSALDEAERALAPKFIASFSSQRKLEVAQIPDSKFPTLRRLMLDKSARSQLRSVLGFADTDKINVVLLLMESVRGFEFFHPQLGPQIFPNLHRLSKKNTVLFKRLYSVSFGAGATVRGMFASFCSMYPNPLGPAPYLSNPSIRAACLQEILASWGYETHMAVASSENYHNKKIFEERHGTRHVVGAEFFDPSKKLARNTLGILDEDYFAGLLEYINTQASKPTPFFLHGINVGTHIPWRRGKLPLPPDVRNFGSGDWLGLVSSFHDFDQHAGKFVEKFLSSPAADNTILIMVADHSNIVGDGPQFWGYPAQVERLLRIPMLIFSKRAKASYHVEFPVSQLDLAPTLINLLATDQSEVESSFAGQILRLNQPDSASLLVHAFPESDAFYGSGTKHCYQVRAGFPVECYEISSVDPLFEKPPELQDPQATANLEFSRKLMESIFLVLSKDQLLPRK